MQLLILEHLTLQSREFANKGSVCISPEEWERLAVEANVPEELKPRIIEVRDLFCCSDQGFLERQGNEYTFNKKHEKAQNHLVEQGKMREIRAKMEHIRIVSYYPKRLPLTLALLGFPGSFLGSCFYLGQHYFHWCRVRVAPIRPRVRASRTTTSAVISTLLETSQHPLKLGHLTGSFS